MPKNQPQPKITALELAPFVGLQCMSNGEIQRLDGVDIRLDSAMSKMTRYMPESVKPILKNLNCLTIEDTVYISCDIMGYDRGSIKEQKKWHKNDLRDIEEYGFIQFDTKDSIYMPQIMHYLTKKGFNLHLIPHGTYLVQDKNGKIEDLVELSVKMNWRKDKLKINFVEVSD